MKRCHNPSARFCDWSHPSTQARDAVRTCQATHTCPWTRDPHPDKRWNRRRKTATR